MDAPMTAEVKQKLELITDAVRANVQPVAIYLFGSYAYGQPTADSDLDIFVVVPDTNEDTFDLGVKIRHDLRPNFNFPLDLLITKQSSFDRRKNRLTFENTIFEEGILLYGR
jgi:predicted nucleotidyltransferase